MLFGLVNPRADPKGLPQRGPIRRGQDATCNAASGERLEARGGSRCEPGERVGRLGRRERVGDQREGNEPGERPGARGERAFAGDDRANVYGLG